MWVGPGASCPSGDGAGRRWAWRLSCSEDTACSWSPCGNQVPSLTQFCTISFVKVSSVFQWLKSILKKSGQEQNTYYCKSDEITWRNIFCERGGACTCCWAGTSWRFRMRRTVRRRRRPGELSASGCAHHIAVDRWESWYWCVCKKDSFKWIVDF